MMKNLSFVFALLMSFATVAPVASAASSSALKKSITQACQSDIQKYCNDVTQGNGRVMACLKAHDDKLSSNCSQQWEAARSQWKSNMKAAHAACSGDVQRFCSNVDNASDITSCLNQHASDLSVACKNFRASNQG